MQKEKKLIITKKATKNKTFCELFKTFEEFPKNGILWNESQIQLMYLLADEKNALPHVLFLDLNMPRKNGFECLSEIKQNDKLKKLPVIIFSTSFEQEVVNQLYQNGAHYFIRKPSEFSQFKKIIQHTLTTIAKELGDDKTVTISQPPKENFVLAMEK